MSQRRGREGRGGGEGERGRDPQWHADTLQGAHLSSHGKAVPAQSGLGHVDGRSQAVDGRAVLQPLQLCQLWGRAAYPPVAWRASEFQIEQIVHMCFPMTEAQGLAATLAKLELGCSTVHLQFSYPAGIAQAAGPAWMACRLRVHVPCAAL